MKTETKICKDCKYFKYKLYAKQDFVTQQVSYTPNHACLHPSSTHKHKAGTDVEGYRVINITNSSCDLMRRTVCKQAVLFEPRVTLFGKVIKLIKGT